MRKKNPKLMVQIKDYIEAFYSDYSRVVRAEIGTDLYKPQNRVKKYICTFDFAYGFSYNESTKYEGGRKNEIKF